MIRLQRVAKTRLRRNVGDSIFARPTTYRRTTQ